MQAVRRVSLQGRTIAEARQIETEVLARMAMHIMYVPYETA